MAAKQGRLSKNLKGFLLGIAFVCANLLGVLALAYSDMVKVRVLEISAQDIQGLSHRRSEPMPTGLAGSHFSDELKQALDSSLLVRVEGSGLSFSLWPQKQSPYIPVSSTAAMSEFNIQLASSAQAWTVTSDRFKTRAQFPQGSLWVQGHHLKIQDRPMPSPVFLRKGANNSIDVVAPLDLERYLFGVLASEVPASWPLEALKAQAVATRSYTLHRLQQPVAHDDYHLKSSVLDQVFKMNHEKNLPPYLQARIRKAIEQTRGEYLADPKGAKVIKAYYHADCGGKTEVAGHVWKGAQSFGVTTDPYCPKSPLAKWSFKMSRSDISKRFHEHYGEATDSKLKWMRLGHKNASGRRQWVTLAFDNGSLYKLTGQKLREILGFHRIKSTQFTVRKTKNDLYVFKGEGHGHGVGLCQWGSRSLALKGFNYREILNHYYPKAQLTKGIKELGPESERLKITRVEQGEPQSNASSAIQ